MKMYSLVVAVSLCAILTGSAGTIYVPNGSFESPDTPFADPRIDAWQDNPKPDWYDESGGFTWDQLTGTFENTDPTDVSHIDNVAGSQAMYMFAVPQVGIFQDYNSVDWAHSSPTHDFNASFKIGRSYQLRLGVISGGGGMIEGTTLSVSMYYRDSANNVITVASTNIIYSAAVFSNTTHFIEFGLRVPTVKESDAWAGQHIGIALNAVILNPLLAGGYWDIDNVRLTESIEVPNGSFESPDTPFADQRIDSWQDNPKPAWYDESGGFLWDQLTGVFENTDPTDPSHIDNVEGTQAMFLFAVPQVGIFQDYDSVDWAQPAPTHNFNVKFEPGKIYKLIVGVIGGGGGMAEGVGLGISLYYHDWTNNVVPVAFTNVAHNVALFSNTTHFVDIPLQTRVVNATDPWAGRNIGIALSSTVGFENMGGYWDIDNVRLEEIQAPLLSTRKAGEIVLQSEPGLTFDILASSNLGAPISSWGVVGTVTNTSGTTTFVDPSPGGSQRFYIARQVP